MSVRAVPLAGLNGEQASGFLLLKLILLITLKIAVKRQVLQKHYAVVHLCFPALSLASRRLLWVLGRRPGGGTAHPGAALQAPQL